jgi:1-acylglycerone phosphate reductase
LQESINETAINARELTSGSLDFLVNNAGVGQHFPLSYISCSKLTSTAYQMPLLDSDISMVKAMSDTNVFSVLTVTQALAPQLIAAKGTIINIGSVGGEFALPYPSMYNASKAALRALSDTMRLELMPFDVKVMTVITGIVRMRIFQKLHTGNTCPGHTAFISPGPHPSYTCLGHTGLDNPRLYA